MNVPFINSLAEVKFVESITDSIDVGKKVIGIFLDLSTAFESA